MSMFNNAVAINFIDEKTYPSEAPFDPPESYPEIKSPGINKRNKVYSGVRDLFLRLKMDEVNYGAASWNPLKDIVKPGMTVFIKPNTVRHFHVGGGDIQSVIVHASVLRPILDYVIIALQNEGRIS